MSIVTGKMPLMKVRLSGPLCDGWLSDQHVLEQGQSVRDVLRTAFVSFAEGRINEIYMRARLMAESMLMP